MESLSKVILLIILTTISVRKSSCGSLGLGDFGSGGLRSEDLRSIDRYVSSGLPYSSDGFVFNSGMGPVIVKVEEPNKVTGVIEQQQPPTMSYYRSLPSVIPEGYEGVASTSFLLGHPITSPPSQYSSSAPTTATSYSTQNVYSTHYPQQQQQIQPSPSHLSYSTNLPPPSYQYQPPQALQRQPQTVTYNSIPQTSAPQFQQQESQPQSQQIFTRSSFQPSPQGPQPQVQFQASPQPQQFQSEFPQPQFTTSAQPQQFTTSVQPQQFSTSAQPQFQTSVQPQQYTTSVQPQQFQGSQPPQQFQTSQQPQQFQRLQSQAVPLSTQQPQQRSNSPTTQSAQPSIRVQNSLRSNFPEKDEFGYDRSLIPTNFIGGTGYRSREELVANPVVEQTFNSELELPEHLRNPFYSNSIVAQMLAQESLPAQGERVVGNWNTNKIREGKIRDLLNGAGFL